MAVVSSPERPSRRVYQSSHQWGVKPNLLSSFVVGSTERSHKPNSESRTNLVHIRSVGDSMPKTDVERQLVMDLPNRADHSRHRVCSAELFLIKKFGDGTHDPLGWSLDN